VCLVGLAAEMLAFEAGWQHTAASLHLLLNGGAQLSVSGLLVLLLSCSCTFPSVTNVVLSSAV